MTAVVQPLANGSRVMVAEVGVGRPVVVVMVVVAGRVVGRIRRRVAVRAARLLPLAVLLVLHAPILEPDLHLALGQVEIARQLPALLLRHVRVE